MQKAVEYVLSIYDTIPGLDESLQMSIIEVIRLDCKNDSAHRVRVLWLSAFLFFTDDVVRVGALDPVHFGAVECVVACSQV